MIRIVSIVVMICAGIFCLAQSDAQTTMPMTRAGLGAPSGVAPGYTGPGDVSGWSGFTAWYSCARAFNAAYAAGTGNACDVVDTATGLTSCTLKLKTNGFADLTSLVCVGNTVSMTTFCTVTHPAGCSVTKMYDQTGNSHPATQATLGNMPPLNLSAFNSLPCPVWAKSTGMNLSLSATMTQPFTTSIVASHVGGSGAAADTIFSDGGVLTFQSGTSANTLTTFAGGANQSVTVSDNALHAIQNVWDDTNSLSAVYLDGSNTLYNGIGTGGVGPTIFIGTSGAMGFPYDGTICEIGFDSISANSTQKSAMNSNQHSAANGYNF